MGPGAALHQPDDDADAALLTPLGEFMQRRNAELGLSVAAVSQRVGMSRATWYRIARGESASPGVRVLRGLARVYKVRAAELFALAEHIDAPPVAPPGPAARPLPEAGDALWRLRYEQRVRAGTWVDVQVEVRNLSGQTWRQAEVRGLCDAWLLPGHPGERLQPGHADHHDLPLGRALLPTTAPGEWAMARLTLRAPSAAGHCIYCLTLHTGDTAAPAGTGVFLSVETR